VTEPLEEQAVGDWLTALASAAPAPGGGAAAALNLAVGAALVSMVCNLTIGKPRYAEHEATMTAALARAEDCRRAAEALVSEDAVAFAAVIAAYKLPKDDEAARRTAIQHALRGAAAVPLKTAERAVEVIVLAERVLDGANVNVVSDVAVAASSARAALQSAQVNVEVNLASLSDIVRADLQARLDGCDVAGASVRADAVVAAVRAKIAG
jgi:formiminotetrahydrofolate cyclodeaminase